jgi:hypothetical protein
MYKAFEELKNQDAEEKELEKRSKGLFPLT